MSLKLPLFAILITAHALLTSADNVITCYGNVQRLACDSGLINMQSVYYGRTDTGICITNRPPSQVNTTTCSANITSLHDRCNGWSVCEFKTDLLGSADPCYGIYKYYNTTFSCISGKNTVICEDSTSSISCGTDIIKVLNAVFGRTNPTTCASGLTSTLTKNTNCNGNVRAKVSTLCDGKTSCSLYASKSNFDDSCPGTSKYLSVAYTCTPALKNVVACEGSDATLACGNRAINVISANYGRTDFTTCIAGQPAYHISTANCYQSDSWVRVVNSCEEKQSCVVPATNDFFSDPCYGTYKFLNISYTCV